VAAAHSTCCAGEVAARLDRLAGAGPLLSRVAGILPAVALVAAHPDSLAAAGSLPTQAVGSCPAAGVDAARMGGLASAGSLLLWAAGSRPAAPEAAVRRRKLNDIHLKSLACWHPAALVLVGSSTLPCFRDSTLF
jgi:hypothetical protein